MIGNSPGGYIPSDLNDLWGYVKDHQNPKYTQAYDYQIFICHDMDKLISEIGNLTATFRSNQLLSQFLVILFSFIGFMLIIWKIVRFSVSLTAPIIKLREYTDEYQKVKSVNEKKDVERKMERDSMFDKVKQQIGDERAIDTFLEAEQNMKAR